MCLGQTPDSVRTRSIGTLSRSSSWTICSTCGLLDQAMRPEHLIAGPQITPGRFSQVADELRHSQVIGIQLHQQGTQQIIVPGRYDARVYLVEQGPERGGNLAVTLCGSDICLQGRASDVHWPGIVPGNGHERIGKCGRGSASPDGLDDQEDKRLMRVVSCRIGKRLTEVVFQIGAGKVSHRRVQVGVAHQPWILVRFRLAGFAAGGASLLDGESSNVTVFNGSERIAFDDLDACGAAVSGQPSGKTAQFRENATIKSGHERESTPHREPVDDQISEVSRRQEFGDLPVRGGHAAFGRGREDGATATPVARAAGLAWGFVRSQGSRGSDLYPVG